MSIAFIYNLFDGCELLEAALTNAKNNGVDENIIVYQTVSYYNNTIKEYNIEDVVDYYLQQKLIDKAIKFIPTQFAEPGTSKVAKMMESQKYQLGLNYIYDKHIEYFAPRAIDEFFIKQEFEFCFYYMQKYKIDRTYCQIVTYSDINKQDLLKTDNIMSIFMYKTLYPFNEPYNKLGYCGKDQQPAPCHIDNVVNYGNGKDYIFGRDVISMHHHRLTRLNLQDKFINSSIYRKNFLKEQIDNIDSIKNNTQITENIFNINFNKFISLFIDSNNKNHIII